MKLEALPLQNHILHQLRQNSRGTVTLVPRKLDENAESLTIDSRRLCECRRVYVAYVCVLHVISVQSILKYRIFTCCQGSLAACRSSSTADT